jgi:segregation and condensation protein B
MNPETDEQDTAHADAPEPTPEPAAEIIDAPVATLPTGDVARTHLKGLIEALVFVSDHPITVAEIAKSAGADKRLVRALAGELANEYAARGIRFEEVAGGYMFRTGAAFAPFVRDVAGKKPVRMSRAQLETMAIVAYRQPITRPEVDDIRGVDSGPVMKMLLDRELVRILGKKDEPGRPLLYGTTPAFLELFGLKSLKDLPSLREFTELSDDSRRVYDREMEDGSIPPRPEVDALAAASPAAAEIAVEASAGADTEADMDVAAPGGDAEAIDPDYSPPAGSS